ncbi:MAG: hypothetical protein SGI73_16090 [Chloroflexota bacterium]|nr:hypothetical protein [Chloroflexota bacterium]
MSARKLSFVLLVLLVIFAVAGLASAQTGYGTTTPRPPTCGSNSSLFQRLSDEAAALFVIPFPPPTPDAQMVAVYFTSCFGLNGVEVISFVEDGLTCANAVAYRVEISGNRERWPITCDASENILNIPGTGLGGHIILYAVGDPTSAPRGVTLSRGA